MMVPAYESLDAALSAQQAYVADLPQWVRMWMGWMEFTFLSSLWFLLARVEARWVLATAVATVFGSLLVGYLFGWSDLWGAVHLVLWTPLVAWLWRRRPSLAGRSGFAVWVHLLMATIITSLAFDIVDLTRWAIAA